MTSEQSRRRVIQIDLLPDEVLLDIFDLYVNIRLPYEGKQETQTWQSLVHVCRRWRRMVFGSPRRLNLRLFCTPETPARDTLDVWPALPLVVGGRMDSRSGTDDVIAALGQSNRICRINLTFYVGWQVEKVLGSMQAPFPELTDLRLTSGPGVEDLSAIPDSFLEGSAPCLRRFYLRGIPFPGLPKLHLSAAHLAELWLEGIPHSGYFSPEVIVALLSALSSLETLSLVFQSPHSYPHQESRRTPPSDRSVIPSLRYFHFKGVTEYLEDLAAFVDTPQLDRMEINYFNQIDFVIPRLAQFINRTPKLWELGARVQFDDSCARLTLLPKFKLLEITVSCGEPDWQFSSIEQVCNSSLYPLSMVEVLHIDNEYRRLVWKDDAIESTLWLQLFLPFTTVSYLYVSKRFALAIAVVLHELVGGRITQVLPNLQKIFVEVERPDDSKPFRETIEQFVAVRRVSSHPIAIYDWYPYL